MMVTVAVLVFVASVHLTGVSRARIFQLTTTSATIVIITAFIVTGLLIGPREPISFAPSAVAAGEITSAPFAISLIYVVYAYTGWNAIGYVAGEIREPQRTIPRAVVGAVLIRRLRPSRIAIAKQLSPPRVPAGEPARIDIEISNRSKLRSPLLRVHDAVTGTRGVQL